LLWHAANWPEEPAFVFRTADHWTTWTWSETARVALAIGRVLRHSYDLRTGDAIVLDVPNGPEWLALDLGAQMIGAYTIPIYAGSPPPSADTAIAAIGEAAHPRVLFTYRPEVVESFRWREAPIVPATTESMLDLIEQAQGEGAADVGDLQLEGADVACGIYVRPRANDVNGGRVLAVAHDHIFEQCEALKRAFEYRGLADMSNPAEGYDRRLTVMPWAHIIERIQSVYLSIIAGITTFVPCDHRDILLDLRDARPTLFSGSSHVYDHLRRRLIDALEARVGDVIDLSQAFSDLETESALRLLDRDIPRELAQQSQGWRDVLVPVVQVLAGNSLRLLTSASRLFDADTVLFFEAVMLRIYRSYGGNWLAGLIATNSPSNWQLDTFGLEVSPYKIFADEHLTVTGPMVWALSGAEKPTRFVDAIPTADVAEVDEGWLRIFGADEEVTGEQRISIRGINLAPTKEESYLMNDPLVDQAVSVGNDMLIVADREALEDWVRRWGVASGASLEEEPEVLERFRVLTNHPVTLQTSRDDLRHGAPTSPIWSHVDEVDVSIALLASLIESASGIVGQGNEAPLLAESQLPAIANAETAVSTPADVVASVPAEMAQSEEMLVESVRTEPSRKTQPDVDDEKRLRAQERDQAKRRRADEKEERRKARKQRRRQRRHDRIAAREERRARKRAERHRRRAEKAEEKERRAAEAGLGEGEAGFGDGEHRPRPG